MNVKELFTDGRAVSPVVGVALLIAITVILAAVIGGVVLGLGTSSAEAPQASLQFEYDDTNDAVIVKHKGGDALSQDNVEARSNVGITTDGFDSNDLSAGGSVTVDMSSALTDGDTVSIVWMDPNSDDEAVLAQYEH